MMDEEEHEDLLVHVSESEESQDESDAYLDPSGNGSRFISCPPFRRGAINSCCLKKRVEFLCTGLICLASSLSLLVLLPLYLESSNQVADVYSVLLFPAAITVVITFCLLFLSAKFGISAYSSFKRSLKPPLPLWRLFQLGALHGLSGICVIYALDRQRVFCHLQDPMKGVTLIFSIIFYFCFSKKLMGLQKIFCATTVVIGLFVSVDYALCDEFHCRGYEREHVNDDTGHWSRAAHFLWGLNYIGGLALWSFHYSLLEGQIVALQLKNPLICASQASLLETISCMISNQGHVQEGRSREGDQHLLTNGEESIVSQSECFGRSSVRPDKSLLTQQQPQQHVTSEISVGPCTPTRVHCSLALSIVFWTYLFNFILVLVCFWTDLVPSIGKSSSWPEFVNNTRNGILCHFTAHSSLMDSTFWENSTVMPLDSFQKTLCSSVALYGWLFTISHVIFSLSASHFLILSQSSVFTIALTTASLPMVNIFWSLFRLIPANGGGIQWWPNFTPELVCTLLGIPVIFTGLTLLCKAHWSNAGVQKELCCTLRYHPQSTCT